MADELTGAVRDAIAARMATVPIFETLGFRDVAFRPGWCSAVVPRQRKYDGIFETFHGGLLMTIADSIAAFAVLTLAGADARITTTDMGIRFLAPATTDITAEARVIKFGRTLVPLHVDLFDAKRTLVAVADVTYMRLPTV
jgi:uncharacterized protein (TIGR00369 family)